VTTGTLTGHAQCTILTSGTACDTCNPGYGKPLCVACDAAFVATSGNGAKCTYCGTGSYYIGDNG
jgi:hypothetical protein